MRVASILACCMLVIIVPLFSYFSCSTRPEEGDGLFTWSIAGNTYTAADGAYATRPGGTSTVIYGVTTGVSNIQITISNCNSTDVYIAQMPPVVNGAQVLVEVGNVSYESAYLTASEQVAVTITSITNATLKGNFTGSIRTSTGVLSNISGTFDVKIR